MRELTVGYEMVVIRSWTTSNGTGQPVEINPNVLTRRTAMATALTEAVVTVCGEDARANTWVVIEGVSRKQWSFGGIFKPLKKPE